MTQEKNPHNDIELKSDEVHEILTRPPHQLIRYGTGVISAVLALLIAGSFFFNYPDIVSGEVVITTENPPAWVTSRQTGYIKEIYVNNNTAVNQGQLLAVIDNPANTTHLLDLDTLLQSIHLDESQEAILPDTLLKINIAGGDVQNAYNEFVQAYINYRHFFSSNLIEQDKRAIMSRIHSRKNYLGTLKKQLEFKQNEFALSELNYNREKRLHQQKVVSDAQLEQALQLFLQTRQQHQQIQTNIAQEEVTSADLYASLQKLDVQFEKEKKQISAVLLATLRNLRTVIARWKQQYLLLAPHAGIVSFHHVWTEHQFVNEGDKVFAIISSNPGKMFARINAPLSGSGKLKEGQTVHIRVDGYPYLEFGMIRGKTANISLVPTGKAYQVEVDLPNPLVTTNHKQLAFSGELTGTALVITENRTLIERIFSPIRYLLSYSK